MTRWRDFVPSSRVSNIQDERASSLKLEVETQKIIGEVKRISDDKSMDNELSIIVHRDSDSPSVSKPEAVVGAITRPTSLEAPRLDRFGDLPSEENANEAPRLVDDQWGYIKGNSTTLNGADVRSNVGGGAQWHRLRYDDANEGIQNLPPHDAAGEREKNPIELSGQNRLGSVERNMSLESQIDAENRAFLDRLSPEEIAEAQEEIRNRVNPGLVKMLRKRGLQKLEKQLNPSGGSDADNVLALGDKLSDKCVAEDERNSYCLESNFAPAMTPGGQNIEKRPEKGVVENLASNSGSMWDNWSKRVEAVRNLRFSLDGNVIRGNWLAPCMSDLYGCMLLHCRLFLCMTLILIAISFICLLMTVYLLCRESVG